MTATYVIPLVMTGVTNADRILNGTLSEGAEAVRCNSSVWLVQPQDYVLYCVKYINKWTGKYLRHGVDKVTENGTTTENDRHNEYVEDDEICQTVTKSLTETILTVTTNLGTTDNPRNISYKLLLVLMAMNVWFPGWTALRLLVLVSLFKTVRRIVGVIKTVMPFI